MNIAMSCLRRVVPCHIGRTLYPATIRSAQRSENPPSRTWDCSLSSRRYLSIGDKFSLTKVLTKDDVQSFADITTDHNPVHVDEAFAKTTRFGKPIAHGVLTLGLASAALSKVHPQGGAILMNLSVTFTAPVYVGDETIAEVEAMKIEGRRATFALTCLTDKKKVLTGEACILLPKS